MTVTLNSGHVQQKPRELVAGRRIMRGFDDDLRAINRAIIHEFASNGSTALAVLNVPNGISTQTTTYSTVGRAKVRVWGNGARLNFHIYGNQTRVRVTLGGVVLGTATVAGSSNAWASMGAVTLAGVTLDSNGMATVLVEVQDTTGSPSGTPTLYHVVIAEEKVVSASLPAAGNTQTSFLAIHDEVYATADDPVDVWALQKLDDNAEAMVFERARRSCIMYPTQGGTQQIARLSSCYWRADGPYVIEVPNHAGEELTVTVTMEVSSSPASLDMDVLVFSEYEEFDAVYVDRLQTISSGSVQYLTFDGIKCQPGRPCMVWLAYRSEVSGSTTTTIEGHSWHVSTPQTLYCARNATLEAAVASAPDGVPWGWCIVMEAEDIAASKDPAIKGSLGYSTPSQLFDICCVQGIDDSAGSDANKALLLTISPHPSTGITRAPEMTAVFKWWTGAAADVVHQPELDIRRCAIGFLYAVDICCAPIAAPNARLLARAGGPVSAGLVAGVVNRVNQMVFSGNSQVLIRHGGNGRGLAPVNVGGTKPLYYAGAYLFCEGSGAGTATGNYLWTVPVAEPNVSSGGVSSLVLWGQFILMATPGVSGGWPNEERAIYRCRWGSQDWVTSEIPLVHRPGMGAQQSPTQADALAAATSTSVLIDSSPQETTANSYGQCVTWPSEGNRKNSPWVYGVPFSDDSQPSFPAILTAEITPMGGARQPLGTMLIIAGLHVWWGPRAE